MKTKVKCLAAVAALALATPAVAQDTLGTTTTDPALTTPATDNDDDDFPWGLLGLLGLAGLLGLKRRERNDYDRDRAGTGTINR